MLPSAKDIFCVEYDPRVHVNHLRWQFQLRRGGNLRQTKGFCLDAAVVVGSWAEVMRSPAVIKCFYFNSAGLPKRVERADDRLTTVRAGVVVGTRAVQIGSIFQLSLSHSAACNLFPGRRNAYLCMAVFSLLWSGHKRAFSRRLRARHL